MKNLGGAGFAQNIYNLKLANNNLITQNQCKSKNIKMLVNGQIILVNVMPKWKIDRLNNHAKYLSTINYNKQKDAELEKRINEIFYNHQIADESEMVLDRQFRDFDTENKW